MYKKNLERFITIALLPVSLASCDFDSFLPESSPTPDAGLEEAIDDRNEAQKTKASDSNIAVNIKNRSKKGRNPF